MKKNILEYLIESVDKRPNHIAVKDEQITLTFAELDRLARQIATQIINQTSGITNQPIAVYLPKRALAIATFLGIVYSGNFYIPIDINSPTERIKTIFSVLEPLCIISVAELENNLSLYDDTIKIYLEECKSNTISEDALTNIMQRKIDTDLLYVMFTSGSTGVPKGVTISHKSVIDYVEWLTDFYKFDRNTVFGNQAPFYFDNSILDIYLTLKHGCTLIIIPESTFIFPQKLFEFMYDNSINTIFWVPSAMGIVASSNKVNFNKMPDLSKIIFCGEVMPVKTLNFWRSIYPNALFANMYGPTEITDVCTCYVVNREFELSETLPIGFACNNTDILVLNENDELVNNDEIGELCVRGTCLSFGYYGSWDKTDSVFVQNPLNKKYPEKIYRTGDLVKYNEYGELIYIGRKDFQIKHMGHRIELGEIENATLAIDGIRECCCFYLETENSICLVCSCINSITEKTIYQYLKSKLPSYMLPGIIKIISKLPLNPNGKIDRKALKSEFQRDN